MSLVNENNLAYIAKYERFHISEFFKDFEECFGTPVTSLEAALSEIMLDFSRYSQLCTYPELTKLDSPDAPKDRRLNNVEKVQRVITIRLQVASLVNSGNLCRAISTLESSASIVATLAYDLCRAPHTE